jgi:pimeloyl-ACP methyl ester carboxylesterase/DNA-binding CsgD family transcriptional regulator
MNQSIRFHRIDGRRLAYATVGDGRLLVMPTWWVSHLEEDWATPATRTFLEALAGRHTVLRYDRFGVGLSDRERAPGDGTLDAEVAVLESLLSELGDERPILFGFSGGGSIATAYAGRRPERVASLVVFGGFASGAEVAGEDVRRAVPDLVRAHWGLGSRVLAEIWFPGADAATLEAFARIQRMAADADTAAACLECLYGYEVANDAAAVACPALVLHRRDDRAVPYRAGRELAALIPGARLVPLDGAVHAPWVGDTAALLAAVGEFLGERLQPPAEGVSELSAREAEVLALVARGLSDAEIAERLSLSPHTVHRHVANVRTKLGQPSRAAAVAHAARLGLI